MCVRAYMRPCLPVFNICSHFPYVNLRSTTLKIFFSPWKCYSFFKSYKWNKIIRNLLVVSLNFTNLLQVGPMRILWNKYLSWDQFFFKSCNGSSLARTSLQICGYFRFLRTNWVKHFVILLVIFTLEHLLNLSKLKANLQC